MADELKLVTSHLSGKPYAIVALSNRTIAGIVPLVEPRDVDHSGSVSWTEAIFTRVPLVGRFTTDANMAEVLITVGREMAKRRHGGNVVNYKYYLMGSRQALLAAFKASRDAWIMLHIGKLVGPAATVSISGAAALTGVRLSAVQYF